jgi:hypothetical protein
MLVPVAEAGLRIIPQNQQIKSMHLNKLSRLAITLSLGTFVQVVSTPKIVQAQIKPSVFKLSEQPNPPTSGQENPPVTDKPDERVAASTRQQPDPSNIERPPVDAVPPEEIPLDTAIHGCSNCLPLAASSTRVGYWKFFKYWKRFKEQSPVPVSSQSSATTYQLPRE